MRFFLPLLAACVALPPAAFSLPTGEKPGRQRFDVGRLLQRLVLPLTVASGLAAIRGAYVWGARNVRAREARVNSSPSAAQPVAPQDAIAEQNQKAMTKLILTMRNNDHFRQRFFGPEGLNYPPPVKSFFFFFFLFPIGSSQGEEMIISSSGGASLPLLVFSGFHRACTL
jgi:hypothetical protein